MKKLLCGILAVVSILALLTACGKTEDVTTTTTTQASTITTTNSDFKLENLNDYVGYWFVDEQKTDFDETNTEKVADIDAIHISQVVEEDGNRAVAIEIYFPDAGLTPYYYGLVSLNENTNYLRVPTLDGSKYHIEFKDGQITSVYLFEDGKQTIGLFETVFTYKTADDTAYEAILDYNTTVFANRYKGYWYMYRLEGQTVLVDELHIKDVYRNSITFDYTYGDEHGENVTADIKNGLAKFAIGDLIGVLDLSSWYIEFSVADNGVSGYTEVVGRFENKSEVPYVKVEENYNLSDYKGYWHQYDDVPYTEDVVGTGPDELYIKKVDGNKVTLSYIFSGVTRNDNVVVEINNNVGAFKTIDKLYEVEATGFIRFEENKVYFAVDFSDGEYIRLVGDFGYHHSYSCHP